VAGALPSNDRQAFCRTKHASAGVGEI
jgi:hypothetical protein